MLSFLLLRSLNLKPRPSPTPTPLPTHVAATSASNASSLSNTLLILMVLILISGIGILIFLFKTGRLRFASGSAYGSAGDQANFRTHPVQSQPPYVPADWRNYPPPPAPYREPPPAPLPAEPDTSLKNKPWLKLVKECVKLFDELEGLAPHLSTGGQEVAEYTLSHLQEALERCGVESIKDEKIFDMHRHQLLAQTGGTAVPPNTPVVETVIPGFAVEALVLRPAKVRVSEQ